MSSGMIPGSSERILGENATAARPRPDRLQLSPGSFPVNMSAMKGNSAQEICLIFLHNRSFRIRDKYGIFPWFEGINAGFFGIKIRELTSGARRRGGPASGF